MTAEAEYCLRGSMEEPLEEEQQEELGEIDLELLSPCARDVLDIAETEARKFGDAFVGTDHVLIGLSRVQRGAAHRVLQALELPHDQLLETMRFIRGDIREPIELNGELAYSPRLMRVLAAAGKDAANRNCANVGTINLLSGLLRERQGLAVFLLHSPGVGLERAGNAIAQAHREGWTDEGGEGVGR
jgi:ATP-dependent Clp protease ATP-binding subunit ClpC